MVSYILLSGHRPFVAVDLPGDLQNAGKAAMVTNILMGRYHFDHAPFKKVNAEGIHFIQQMLHPSYQSRWQAVDALNSAWLSGSSAMAPVDFAKISSVDSALSRAVSNLRKKAGGSSLRNTSMVAVAFNNSGTDYPPELRNLFQTFDTESVGYLTREAFRQAMKSVSPDLSNEDIDQLFAAIDVDNDQTISFTEFLAATMDPRTVNTDDLSKAFRLLDSENKGYLTAEDFCRVLSVKSGKEIHLRRKRKSESRVDSSEGHSR